MKFSLDVDVVRKDGEVIITDRKGKAITFSKDQNVQKKVTMIALGEMSNLPKKEVAKSFGYSTRKSYYDARTAVINGKQEDLIPKRTGPKKAPKRTRELEKKIIQMRFETTKNMYEIAAELQRSGNKVSPRLVGQVLTDWGFSKKNRRIKNNSHHDY